MPASVIAVARRVARRSTPCSASRIAPGLPATSGPDPTCESSRRSRSTLPGVISESISRLRARRLAIIASRTRSIAGPLATPRFANSSRWSSETSNSRTGPKARVMRRYALTRAVDGGRVERFAEHRQGLAQAARCDASLVDRADVPCLRGRHGVNQRFEALTQQDEESRTMVHTKGLATQIIPISTYAPRSYRHRDQFRSHDRRSSPP